MSEREEGPEVPLPSILLCRPKWQHVIVFAVLAALATIGVSAARYIAAPAPNLSLQAFERIKLGMTVSDVNGIFGMRGEKGPCMLGECHWVWRQGDNSAHVSFGQRDGKVTCGYFVTPDGEQHWLERKDGFKLDVADDGPTDRGEAISLGNFRKLRLGMTREEVIAVIGMWPGHYDGPISWVVPDYQESIEPNFESARAHGWIGRHSSILITYDLKGKLTNAQYELYDW
jgi:hypothetical protein